MTISFRDPVVRNVAALAALSVLQALQLLILAALILSFVPIPATPWVQKLFSVYWPEVRPEREMDFFHWWVFAAIAAQAAWIWWLRRRLAAPALWQSLTSYGLHTLFWIFVQLFAVFKIFVWGDMVWARVVLYAAAGVAVASQFFWPEVQAGYDRLWWQLTGPAPTRKWAGGLTPGAVADAGMLVLIALALWPANLDSVLGRMFLRDQFYHLDGFLMTPAWGALKGLVLNQDMISQYSLTMPIVFGRLLSATVGFDYPSVVATIIISVILYYWLFYIWLARWLHHRALAVFGALLAIKLQMFHWGVAPLAWQFPTALPLRHWPDIVFLFCLWGHARNSDFEKTASVKWLWGMAASCGLALVWVTDVGVYLTAAMIAYLVGQGWYFGARAIPMVRTVAVHVLISVGVAAVALSIIYGGLILQPEFWRNTFEHVRLFLSGWGALPMTSALKDKQFFAFLMGFAIPIVYVATLLSQGAGLFLRKGSFLRIIPVVACVYGLGLNHYFIHRSGVTSYYAVCIPLVVVICFWLKLALSRLPTAWQRPAALSIGLAMAGALMTSYLFVYYPNVLNLARLPWPQESQYYRAQFDFSADATLIRAMTPPGARVPLISSFETKILMQADRAPFFYYSPLIESSLEAEGVRLTYLHTDARANKTIAQLQTHKPPAIFVEKKWWTAQGQQGLTALVDHIKAHYTLADQGPHLMAFKRKD